MYGATEGLCTVVVEAEAVGGQAGTSSMIRNYLGFPRGISGMRLAQRARNQAIRFGTRFFTGWEVAGISTEGEYHVVHTDGGDVRSRAVVIASGVAYRKLRAPGIDDLTGIGVFYGSAMTAAREIEGYDVVVVGGGNSAGQAAIHLARFAKSVTIHGPSRQASEETHVPVPHQRGSSGTPASRSPPAARSPLPVATAAWSGSTSRTATPTRSCGATPRGCSCSSAPSRTATGCPRTSPATTAGSC